MNNVKQVNIQYLESPEEADRSKTMMAGKFLWPGFTHNYEVFSREVSDGSFRYKTGLEPDEFPEDKQEEIREVRKRLEKYFNQSLSSDNVTFWKNIKVVLDKKNVFLNLNEPKDELIYYIIKGGGIYEIGATYDEATESSIPKRWFLVEPGEAAELSAETDRTLDKALARLVDLDENKTHTDMFLIHKVLVPSERGATKDTPKSALYKDLTDYIKGRLNKGDKRTTPTKFIETYDKLKKDKGSLFITAYIKDAIYYNFIFTSEDNQLQNIQTKTKYGATIEKTTKYLIDPANEAELQNIKERVEAKWAE